MSNKTESEITKILPHRLLLIMTGFVCNNNCIICSVKPKGLHQKPRKTKEIIADMKRGRRLRYDNVDFTGGEPTIRPDILSLIKIAKDLGYQTISISTNGKMLSYGNFCQKIIENGLNVVTFTLNAHNSRLENAICRTPGVFNQTVQGIRNMLAYPLVKVNVNTVVFQLNYKYLRQIGEFIRGLGVEFWNILDLIPDGYAKKYYKTLVVNPLKLSGSFSNLNKVIDKFALVHFIDFPLCLFSPPVLKNYKVKFMTAQNKTEIVKQTGYRPIRFEKSTNDFYKDIYKQRIGICKKCRFYKFCGGIWRDGLVLHYDNEIEYLAKKYGCLLQK